jgi:hypothetical protein
MIAKRCVVTLATVLLMLAAIPRGVAGQEIAGSFEQLRVLVKAGDKVSVAHATGSETKGTIVDMSAAALALLVAGERREILAQEISTIRHRRDDSLANGAKMGFTIGAGLGLLAGVQVASRFNGIGAAHITAVSLLYGALGTGIGVGLDALITREQVIFAARASAAGAPDSIRIRPVFTGEGRGLVLSIGF